MKSMKKKIRIEYPLNPASGTILWGAISTPSGLQRWFADNVSKVERLIRSSGEKPKLAMRRSLICVPNLLFVSIGRTKSHGRISN